MHSHETGFVCECRIFNSVYNSLKYQKPLHSSGSQRGYSPLLAYSIPPEKKGLPKVSSFFAG